MRRASLAYTPDSRWRNRAEFPQGRGWAFGYCVLSGLCRKPLAKAPSDRHLVRMPRRRDGSARGTQSDDVGLYVRAPAQGRIRIVDATLGKDRSVIGVAMCQTVTRTRAIERESVAGAAGNVAHASDGAGFVAAIRRSHDSIRQFVL